MKKLLSILAAVSLLAVLVLPAVSLAVDLNPSVPVGGEVPTGCKISNNIGITGCDPGIICPAENTGCGVCCLLNTIYTVTNWVFYIMTLVAVLMIIYGGFTYIAAAGDPAKASKGKTVLTLSIIGLAIALIAKIIPSLVKFILGV